MNRSRRRTELRRGAGGAPRLRFGGQSAIVLLVLVALALVVASPWALRALGAFGLNWKRLSDVGQTYGAASAVIAAIALAGVCASIVIQVREAKTNRKNAQRGHHTDLLRLAMDDPLYMECWGPYLTETYESERQYTYVNLIITEWHAEFTLGEIDAALLRATASSVFMSRPGRVYWESARAFWRDNYSDRRSRRFFDILDATYRSLPSTPTGVSPDRDVRNARATESTKPDKRSMAAALGFSIGVAAGVLIGSRTLTRFRFRRR